MAEHAGHSYNARDATGHPLPCHTPPCSGECLQARYGARWLAFRERHAEAFDAVAFATSQAQNRAAIERLHREFETLPARHLCSCICPNEERRNGTPACVECTRLRRAAVQQDVAVELGHTARPHPPMPSPDWLDEGRAHGAGRHTPGQMARYLNGEE